MNGGVRIEHEGAIAGAGTKVFYVAKDGTETDISDHVMGITASMRPGELVSVHLKVIVLEWKQEAKINDLVLDYYGKHWRFTHRLRHKWKRVVRDITPVGAKARRYTA